MINSGDVAEATDLFLRHPFDPRGEGVAARTGSLLSSHGKVSFSSALFEGRKEWRKRGAGTPAAEATIEEAIQIALALKESIEMRMATQAFASSRSGSDDTKTPRAAAASDASAGPQSAIAPEGVGAATARNTRRL